MKIKTSITNIKDGNAIIRGHELSDLIKEKSFAETIFLLLKGTLPNEAEAKMINALFVAAIDHGPGTASGQTARIVASAKNSMHTSVAAGILAMGERHGSAIEGAAEFFLSNNACGDIPALVAELKKQKIRVPGYGHVILKKDHRSDNLFALAKDLGLYGDNCAFAAAFHKALNEVSSKELPLNVDGSMAAVLSDMGFDSGLMKGFFIIARVPGLVAHVREEQMSDEGLRRMSQDDIEFIG